jgi:histidyl-tRNA synthetase
MKNKLEELKKELIEDIKIVISLNEDGLKNATSYKEIAYWKKSIDAWKEEIEDIKKLELNYNDINYLCNYFINRGFDLRKLKPFYEIVERRKEEQQ